MSSNRFTEEFRIKAVKQVTERGYPVKEVSERLGASPRASDHFVLSQVRHCPALPPATVVFEVIYPPTILTNTQIPRDQP